MAKITWKTEEDVLEELKKAKSDEMSRECQKRILEGFDETVKDIKYHFSYDLEAQSNFQETYRLFENNVVENVMWSARLGGGKVRVPLNKSNFYKVYFSSVRHKFDMISKYNDSIIPLINQSKIKEEVESVSWDSKEDVVGSINLTTDNKLEDELELVKVAQAQGDMEILSLIMMGGVGF